MKKSCRFVGMFLVLMNGWFASQCLLAAEPPVLPIDFSCVQEIVRFSNSDTYLSEKINVALSLLCDFLQHSDDVQLTFLKERVTLFCSDLTIALRQPLSTRMQVSCGVIGDFYTWLNKYSKTVLGKEHPLLVRELCSLVRIVGHMAWGNTLGFDGGREEEMVEEAEDNVKEASDNFEAADIEELEAVELLKKKKRNRQYYVLAGLSLLVVFASLLYQSNSSSQGEHKNQPLPINVDKRPWHKWLPEESELPHVTPADSESSDDDEQKEQDKRAPVRWMPSPKVFHPLERSSSEPVSLRSITPTSSSFQQAVTGDRQRSKKRKQMPKRQVIRRDPSSLNLTQEVRVDKVFWDRVNSVNEHKAVQEILAMLKKLFIEKIFFSEVILWKEELKKMYKDYGIDEREQRKELLDIFRCDEQGTIHLWMAMSCNKQDQLLVAVKKQKKQVKQQKNQVAKDLYCILVEMLSLQSITDSQDQDMFLNALSTLDHNAGTITDFKNKPSVEVLTAWPKGALLKFYAFFKEDKEILSRLFTKEEMNNTNSREKCMQALISGDASLLENLIKTDEES